VSAAAAPAHRGGATVFCRPTRPCLRVLSPRFPSPPPLLSLLSAFGVVCLSMCCRRPHSRPRRRWLACRRRPALLPLSPTITAADRCLRYLPRLRSPYKKYFWYSPSFKTPNPRRPGIPAPLGLHGASYPGFRGPVWSRSRKSRVDRYTGARVDCQRQPIRFLQACQSCGPPRGGTRPDSDEPTNAVSPPLTVVSERTVPPFRKWRVEFL